MVSFRHVTECVRPCAAFVRWAEAPDGSGIYQPRDICVRAIRLSELLEFSELAQRIRLQTHALVEEYASDSAFHSRGVAPAK